MVDDSLLTDLPFEELAVTPQPHHITPHSIRRQQRALEFKDRLSDANIVVITHNDADGLGAGALLKAIGGSDNVTVTTTSYEGPWTMIDAISVLTNENVDLDQLFIADLNTSSASIAHDLQSLGCPITWFDHHQWDGEVLDYIQEEVDDIEFVINEDECATSIIYRRAIETGYQQADHIEDLVRVTKDRDLWINEDSRSEQLAMAAWVLDDDEYMEIVLEYGPDFPDHTLQRLQEERRRSERLEERAIRTAKAHQIGQDFAVAVTYTRGGQTTNIGNHLVEEMSRRYDIAVVMTPTSISFYSHSNREGFTDCHTVAKRLGGGGHPTAAGCGIPVDTFRDLARYWSSCGNSVLVEIMPVIGEVADVEVREQQ